MIVENIDMVNTDVSNDIARYILGKLDPAKRKTDIPVKPIIAEFFGTHKAGTDTH